MKYGERYQETFVNKLTREKITQDAIYKYTTYGNYHTNKEGDGLWCGDKQIVGTCDFSVAGCRTEKAAKAKIRNYVKNA